MNYRLPGRLLLATLALLSGGLWSGQPSHAEGISKPVIAKVTYQLGRLTFHPCSLRQPRSGMATKAWCAPFTVPENGSNPQGLKIHLRLALIRSRAVRPSPDPVVYLAGGPGQSAINTYPELAPALHGLLEHRNIILLDQRGTGGSAALSCPIAEAAATRAADAAARQTSENKTGGGKSQEAQPVAAAGLPDLQKIRSQTRACLAEISKKFNPRDFTTTQAVHDLQALRLALGGVRFNLIGVSYGTRVAQQYLMRYPQGVRSVVLDSVVPNPVILGSGFAFNLDVALKKDFALCTAEPACYKAFGNPWLTLQRLKAKLTRQPVEVRFPESLQFAEQRQTLTAAKMVGLVRLYAYSPLTAALLPLTLHAAAEGRYGPLLAQSDLVSNDLSTSINSGMQLAVICSEDAPDLKPNPAAAATLLGNGFVRQLLAECAIWPRGAVPKDFHQPLHSKVPVLILEGQFDPVTPPRYGREVLAGLPNGRLLIAKGQGHNVIGAGCLPSLVKRFVATADAKALDARCLNALGPTPPFFNYNGAGP